MIKSIPLFLLIIYCSSIGAQSRQDQINQQINELMKARAEMIKSLFSDSEFQGFDKHFENLLKDFQKNSFIPDAAIEGPVIGEYDWRENEAQRVFVLKVKQIKDRPLDIKIEKGHIRLSGDVESVNEDSTKKSKSISKVHFERVFTIPEGVDLNNPEFENNKGELLIKFKKIKISKDSIKNQGPKEQQQLDDRHPIDKNENDITI